MCNVARDEQPCHLFGLASIFQVMTQAWTMWLAADGCATDAGWLTAPRATVIAALIAVLGALIAFGGVLRTTGTTRRENRRAESTAVLTDAATAIQELTRAVDRVALTAPAGRASRVAEMDAGPMKALGDAFTMSATKLELYGFDAAAKETQGLEEELIALWDRLRQNPAAEVDLTPCHQRFDKTLTAIKKARTKLP